MTNREKFTEIFGCEIAQHDNGEAIPGHCKILIASDKHFNDWLKQEYVPSAQLEIVRCGQCKYAEVADAQDNQDGYTCQFHRGSIWFSGSYCSWGERRTDDKTNKGSSC